MGGDGCRKAGMGGDGCGKARMGDIGIAHGQNSDQKAIFSIVSDGLQIVMGGYGCERGLRSTGRGDGRNMNEQEMGNKKIFIILQRQSE